MQVVQCTCLYWYETLRLYGYCCVVRVECDYRTVLVVDGCSLPVRTTHVGIDCVQKTYYYYQLASQTMIDYSEDCRNTKSKGKNFCSNGLVPSLRTYYVRFRYEVRYDSTVRYRRLKELYESTTTIVVVYRTQSTVARLDYRTVLQLYEAKTLPYVQQTQQSTRLPVRQLPVIYRQSSLTQSNQSMSTSTVDQ